MKLKTLFVLVMTGLVLTACAAGQSLGQTLTQLPDEGVQLVFFVVSAGVTWCLLKLSEVTNVDLKGYAPAVAVALAPILTALIESWLQLIPPAFDNIVLTIIHLIVLAVGSLGVFFIAKRKAPSLR